MKKFCYQKLLQTFIIGKNMGYKILKIKKGKKNKTKIKI
jgi:hypothetical protein